MMHRPTRRTVLVGTVALAAVPVPFAASAEPPTRHEIEIKSFAFQPDIIQVRPGDTIRWINRDLAPHTATADAFGWDTGALETNEFADVLATEGMETTYFCAFHPHMKASIEILQASVDP